MTKREPFLTVKEAAVLMGTSEDTVYHHVRSEHIPPQYVRRNGRSIRILDAYFEAEQPTPIRFDMRQENELIATLKKAVRDLQTENLTLATENLKLKAAANLRELQVA